MVCLYAFCPLHVTVSLLFALLILLCCLLKEGSNSKLSGSLPEQTSWCHLCTLSSDDDFGISVFMRTQQNRTEKLVQI